MTDRLEQLERRIRHFEDIEEIERLISGWARAGDTQNNAAGLAATLTKDAVWTTSGFETVEGRDAIVKYLRKVAQERIHWSIHFMTSPVINIDEQRGEASVFWYVWEAAKTRDGPADVPKPSWIAGWYENIAKKEDGQWRFSRVNAILKLFTSISAEDWEVLVAGRNPLPR